MNDEPKREEPPETPASEIEVPEESEMPAPLTSPFLPDAKVEKRPLGGNTLEETEDTGELSRAPAAIEEDVKKTVDDPNNQLPADPSEVNVELPEELHADLMAVEADTTHAEVKRAHEAEPEAIVPQEKEESTTPTEAKPEVKPVEESPVAAGPTSIPQQYREEPSTGDHDNGSIYDTDTYHQPLAHPVQKKSGWMWVVGIVGILLLGAAAGATLYFLKLV
jgi:cobalamin biosynthesis Mg chelatase CobN